MRKEENNLLIARYMSDEPDVLEKDLNKAGTLESMQYHIDWNWLMPVVQKIEQNYDVVITCSNQKHTVLIIKSYDVKETLIKVSHKDKMTAIWNACVKFIKTLK